jgi:iron complex transport system substrate-binding protein
LLVRVVLASIVLALGVGGLTACGASGSSSSSGGAPDGGAFPVTVTHKYGHTVVPAPPKRVVALGDLDQDALLALGVIPVATSGSPIVGTGSTSALPWLQGRFGGQTPATVKTDPGLGGVPIETVRPDLILAVSTGYSPGLSPYRYGIDQTIAPTIAGPAGSTAGIPVPWQDYTRLIGQAVGKPVEAERLINGLNAMIARTASRYPRLRGKTAACLQDKPKGPGLLDPERPRSSCQQFLAGLGMRSVPALDQAAGTDTADIVTPEQLAGPARPDVVVLDGFSEGARDAARYRLPAGLPVVILDDDEAAAVGGPSVLSLPSALDTVPPKLARAIG